MCSHHDTRQQQQQQQHGAASALQHHRHTHTHTDSLVCLWRRGMQQRLDFIHTGAPALWNMYALKVWAGPLDKSIQWAEIRCVPSLRSPTVSQRDFLCCWRQVNRNMKETGTSSKDSALSLYEVNADYGVRRWCWLIFRKERDIFRGSLKKNLSK